MPIVIIIIIIIIIIIRIWKCKEWHLSGQLSSTKKSWSNTQLKRCTKTDRRWNYKTYYYYYYYYYYYFACSYAQLRHCIMQYWKLDIVSLHAHKIWPL